MAPMTDTECIVQPTSTDKTGPAMTRIASFWVDYKRNKFPIKLPSRREASAGVVSSVRSLSQDPMILNFPEWTVPSNRPPHSLTNHMNGRQGQDEAKKMEQLEANFEFVYFEDLMVKLRSVLKINAKQPVLKLDGPMFNYRCTIYNKEFSCFNLLIRYDGHVIDTLETMATSSYASPYGIDRNLVDPNVGNRFSPLTKVYDLSIICLFKEAFNLSLHLKTVPVSDVEEDGESVDGEVVVDDIALDDGPMSPDATPPNLDDLPHTKSAFSLSADSDFDSDDDSDQSTTTASDNSTFEADELIGDEESAMDTDAIPERCVLDSDEEEMDEIMAIIHTTQKRRRRRRSTNGARSFDRLSISTIYSEESFQVIIDEEEAKTFATYAISDSSESDDEDEEFKAMQAAPDSSPDSGKRKSCDDQDSEESRSIKSIRSSDTSRSSCSSRSSASSQFDDPYENPDCLQAQERCLDENDIVYSQTVEIVSDDEIDSDGKRRDGSKSDLNSFLERMPLQDVYASISYIREHLLLKKSDIRQRQELVNRMQQVLIDHGFNCQLYIFGSTKNCLGMRTSSDIDIFIQLKDKEGNIIDESHISYGKIERVLNSIDLILGKDQSYLDVITKQSGEKAEITVNTICHRHMRVPITRIKIYLSSIPVLGTNAKVSEITPDHVLQCDLNVNNALGISNTRLIRFLCKFEPRFFLLNVLLRFWCKYEANLNKPDALSSYALSNLILFFCQMRKPALLPSIDYLVRLSTSPKIVNDWRCDFCKDLSRIDFKTKNKESIMQLFVGFFQFYKTFNFLQFKISTRFARAWRLRVNRNRRAIGGRGGRGIGNKGGGFPYVHIMDPFEQNHNLTARMRPQMFDKMCLEFNNALERYRKFL